MINYKNCGQPIKIHNMQFYNCDCEKLMKETPDNYYELCIVDPPYGIGMAKGSAFTNQSGKERGFTENRKYDTKKQWDNQRPDEQYFNELVRVSKNQIICGGNYFADYLKASRCWIFWHKKVNKTQGMNFADGELIYTSFDKNSKYFQYGWLGLDMVNQKDEFAKIHPTQKPVALYKWLLKNYAKEGDNVLDTHLGSMSIAIACHYAGYELTGCELDEEYFNTGIERVRNQTRQRTLL